MPTVQQVAYVIPDEIAAGFATGTMSRFGSVVRDSKGIIAHLKEIPIPGKRNQLSTRALVGVIVGSIVGGIVVTGGAAYGISRLLKKKKVKKRIEEFSESFQVYLDAIQEGKLTSSILYNLESTLSSIKETAEKGWIKIDIIPEVFDSFKAMIADYTKQLAKANSVPFDENSYGRSTGDNIIDIKKYLYKQAEILDA